MKIYIFLLFGLASGFVAPKSNFLKFPKSKAINHDIEIIKQFELNAKQMIRFKDRLENENAGDLLQKIKEEELIEIAFNQDLNTIISLDKDYKIFKTDIHPFLSTDIVKDAAEHHINIKFIPFENRINVFQALLYLPLALLGINLIRNIFFNPMPFGGGSGMFEFESKFENKKSNTTLQDWAGSPEIFEECTEIISFLKNKETFSKVGAKIPKGILLEGPPGTGKTMLAKAIANEAKANFIATTGSEFVELFVGMGASRIRKLFKEARKYSPSIIFIDEIDAIGKQRNANGGFGSNDERDQTLNQLLAEMDGFVENQNLLIIAATNRRDILDNALLRPGRFDRIIQVPLPDRESRRAILKTQIKSYKVDEQIDLEPIISLTSGFSGADLKNLLNEAAILVAREGGYMIQQKHIFAALEKLIVGIIKKYDLRDQDTLERVAIHELGHTIPILTFPEYFDFDKVTIQSTYKGAGGYTIFREKENITESGMYTKDFLKKKLMIQLGGKAAETLFYGREKVSLGAFQDLKQANSLAKQMIQDFGMGNKLEIFAGIESQPSQYILASIDKEVLNILNEAYHDVFNLLVNNKDLINNIKNDLIDKKTLNASFFKQ